MRNDICVQCGEHRNTIRREGMICGIMSESTESCGAELEYEYPRHRFKPYSKEELASQQKDEEEYVKQMGDMADWNNEMLNCKCGNKVKRSNLEFDEDEKTFHCPKCKIEFIDMNP